MQLKTRHPLFLVLALLAAIVLVGAGLVVRARVADTQVATGPGVAQAPATPVRVAKVERRVILEQAEFHGFLVPFTELALAAQIPGEIVRQWVDVSDEVEAGDPLFKIDDAVRKIEHEQAIAAEVRADSEYELAEANWERIKALSEETSSSMERIEARTRYRAAKADQHRAEAAVRRMAVLLERTVVKSPIDGVVSRVHQRQGEFTQAGQPLVDVIEIDRLKLLAQLEGRHVVWVKAGDPAVLTTSTFPGERFTGTVHRIYPQALPTSRKFEVEIELPNPGRRLRPGFFMTGAISRHPRDEAARDSPGVLTIPREAVVELYGQHFCYAVHPVGEGAGSSFEARRTAVEVWPIPSDPRSFQLVSGVAEGDPHLPEGSLVVTKGHQHLSEQAAVRITD